MMLLTLNTECHLKLGKLYSMLLRTKVFFTKFQENLTITKKNWTFPGPVLNYPWSCSELFHGPVLYYSMALEIYFKFPDQSFLGIQWAAQILHQKFQNDCRSSMLSFPAFSWMYMVTIKTNFRLYSCQYKIVLFFAKQNWVTLSSIL